MDISSLPLTLILFSLLSQERKLTTVHLNITPNTEYTDPIRSKEDLILQSWPQSLRVNPLFSQSPGSASSNGLHKYDRFLQPGNPCIASIISSVILGPLPILLLKEPQSGLQLVASGSVLDADKKRVVVKRAILSGDPFKVHKVKVTVRFMFFNPEDVRWFAAVPLSTKHDRHGYLKETLGTHGHFKATFDGKITQMDNVQMKLYKQVWPEVATPY